MKWISIDFMSHIYVCLDEIKMISWHKSNTNRREMMKRWIHPFISLYNLPQSEKETRKEKREKKCFLQRATDFYFPRVLIFCIEFYLQYCWWCFQRNSFSFVTKIVSNLPLNLWSLNEITALYKLFVYWFDWVFFFKLQPFSPPAILQRPLPFAICIYSMLLSFFEAIFFPSIIHNYLQIFPGHKQFYCSLNTLKRKHFHYIECSSGN